MQEWIFFIAPSEETMETHHATCKITTKQLVANAQSTFKRVLKGACNASETQIHVYLWWIKNALHMRHSSPNRPSRDPHYFWFFFHVIYWRVSQKNTVQEVLDFNKKMFEINITQHNLKKLKMTLLKVINLYKIWPVNFVWKKQIFWAMGKSGCFGLEFMRK